MYSFVNNSDGSPLEVVLTPSLFTKDPFMRLKRKRLSPTIDLKMAGGNKSKHRPLEPRREEEDTPHPLAWKKGKKTLLIIRGSKKHHAPHLLQRGQRYT